MLSTPTFNPLACAALHNEIVALIATTAREEYDNTIVHDYFAAYNDANDIRSRLSKPLITFLENIDVPLGEKAINIAPHAHLSDPEGLWAPIGGVVLDREGPENWVALYRGTWAENDLYFDLDSGACTWLTELDPWPVQWYSLERTLALWLHLYKVGKFQPSCFDGTHSFEAVHQYTSIDLDDSLRAYDELTNAILARSPDASDVETKDRGLVDQELIDEFGVQGLLRDFLSQARKPSFTFIAPGIRLPETSELREILSADVRSERYNIVRQEGFVAIDPGDIAPRIGEPLPLFLGPSFTSKTQDFVYGRGRLMLGEVSGLYIWPEQWFADTCLFVLPYAIGVSGYIEEGNPGWIHDGTPRDDVPEVLVTNDALYQHGSCPFMPEHLPRLSTILRQWTHMVNSGQWSVGPDGVEGGIEVWKEAHTLENYKEYRLGACFDEVYV